MSTKKYPYKHRDLNWLSFNERVLQEAEDSRNPLYERLKFLAIFSSNLDEYFRVRLSRLRQIKKIDKKIRKKLALKPSKLVKEIIQIVELQQERFGTIMNTVLIPELKQNGIHLTFNDSFTALEKEYAKKYFDSTIKSHIDITIIDGEQSELPFLKNNDLYYVITFQDVIENIGIINIPTRILDRFVSFPSKGNIHTITFLDEIVKENIATLFPNHKIEACYQIKVSRDAELYIEDEFDGVLAQKIKESLDQRGSGQPTRLLYDASMPKPIKKLIRTIFKVGKIDMVPGGKHHNFSDFFGFPDPTNNSNLHYQSVELVKHKNFENHADYFEIIAKQDQLVHFPYMSFDYVQNLIDQAASDPTVTEIKISLYRVAKESDLTSALLKALKNGKKVIVFVEAKARFDEENNLKWGEIFESNGASVFYSYPKIKVHSKILLIKRTENRKNKLYGYIGTGNFNAKTSKIYCDHGLLTARPEITSELDEVFNVLSGRSVHIQPKHLLVSPFITRQKFEKLIDIEIENAKRGFKAQIISKLNSLEDKQMINKLYEASQAGVKITLVVRGFSCLIPGIEGISENIRITSILDRYLEHGRIYYFENNGDPNVFIGSADWMTRNLDKRIEVLTPILDESLKKELIDILQIQVNDNIKARIHDIDESNHYQIKKDEEEFIQSQNAIREYLLNIHSKQTTVINQTIF
ncbi:polyphosphate kinase 1 [Aquimarina algicola]|uniref:Polyphosphate kinase n=1 Tax=Aquimarina algicola TaxID=2589995 RepID=A0A504JEQ2_9FLAO|nr:polyphosphate kinase 1 [Aquimarina algicola]TPN89154.1 polyphosphate kinase 1 [Aquimarina algicola]